jgi:hypothetical protein
MEPDRIVGRVGWNRDVYVGNGAFHSNVYFRDLAADLAADIQRAVALVEKPLGKHEGADAIFQWLGVHRDALPPEAVQRLQEIAGGIVCGLLSAAPDKLLVSRADLETLRRPAAALRSNEAELDRLLAVG